MPEEQAGGGDQGQDPGSVEPLGREEFVSQANAICASATAAINELPNPESLSDIADAVPELEEIARRELESLRALADPVGEDDQLDPAYYSLLERQIDLLERLGEAAASGDNAEAQQITADAASLNLQATSIALEYGLVECAGGAASDVAETDEEDVPADPPTPEEAFLSEADSICIDSRDRVAELREPVNLEESVTAFDAVVEISNEELAELQKLQAPPALEESFGEMLELVDEQIATLVALGDALVATDRDAAGEALLASSRLNAEINLLQQELGLQVCGTEPVQIVPSAVRPSENG